MKWVSHVFWRGARVVELARLERVYGRKVIQGSNPCLSARKMTLAHLPLGSFCILDTTI